MLVPAAFKAAEQTLTYIAADDFDDIIKALYGMSYNIIRMVESHNGTYYTVYQEDYYTEEEIAECLVRWKSFDDGTTGVSYPMERDYLPQPYILFADLVNRGVLPPDYTVLVHIWW